MKITLNPIREVLITNLVKLDIETITKERSIVERPLMWCDGYLINCFEDEGEFITENKAKGILYLDSVLYSECKEKITESKVDGIVVSVLDYSTHPLFKEIVKAIPKLEAEN